MESIAEDAENMDQHSDHEDVRSEHSDQDHDNPPVEHDDGVYMLPIPKLSARFKVSISTSVL